MCEREVGRRHRRVNRGSEGGAPDRVGVWSGLLCLSSGEGRKETMDGGCTERSREGRGR